MCSLNYIQGPPNLMTKLFDKTKYVTICRSGRHTIQIGWSKISVISLELFDFRFNRIKVNIISNCAKTKDLEGKI